MTTPYQLSPKDFEEYSKCAWRRLWHSTDESTIGFGWNIVVFIPFGITGAALFDFITDHSHGDLRPIYIALGGLVLFVALLLVSRTYKSRRFTNGAVLKHGAFLAPTNLTITDSGIRTESSIQSYELYWGGILDVAETESLIVLFNDGMGALVVPKRAFQDEKAAADFIERCKKNAA